MTDFDSLRAARQDWRGYARREASALLDEIGVLSPRVLTRDQLLDTLAAAWLQGADFGAHGTLAAVDEAFKAMKGDLS